MQAMHASPWKDIRTQNYENRAAFFFVSLPFHINAISETTESERQRTSEKENISDSSHLHKTHFIQVVSYKNKNYDFDIIFSAKLNDTNVWNLIFNQ